jgi:integrase
MSRKPIPDAARLCRPLALWPAADQARWAEALRPGSMFNDGGELAGMRAVSQAKYAKGWGRWLSFVDQSDPAALDLPPALRCAKDRVKAYIGHLRSTGNAAGAIVNRLQELAVVARIMDPGFDASFINRAISVLRSKATPARSKAHVRPTNELVDLGFDLMAKAADRSDARHAVRFRDGLIIAFLALHPLRRRNLADFHLGRNLIRMGKGFMVVFASDETKTGAWIEAPLAEVLIEPMEQYLRLWRPVLAGRRGRWTAPAGQAVWVSSDGSPMTEEGLSGRIERHTARAFGKAMSPHRFRDAAATTLVIADPARVRVAAPLLGHRSLATTEKHYIQARGLEAQRSYLEVIEEARRGQS